MPCEELPPGVCLLLAEPFSELPPGVRIPSAEPCTELLPAVCLLLAEPFSELPRVCAHPFGRAVLGARSGVVLRPYREPQGPPAPARRFFLICCNSFELNTQKNLDPGYWRFST